MRPSFLGFETSKRALQAAQKSLDITNNNIANRDKVGYTRQRVDLHSMSVLTTDVKWNSATAKLSLAGAGVRAVGVAQIRDAYIDKRYREIASIEAENYNSLSILNEIEDVLDNIENTGLKMEVEDFSEKLNIYSMDRPDSVELANVVRNSALNIVQMLKTYSFKFDQIESGIAQELAVTTDGFNSIIEKIAALNKQIAIEYTRNYGDKVYESISVTSGYGPNELLDARNLLLDELASYGNIQIDDNSDGTVTVKIGDTTVVNGDKTTRLIMRDYEKTGAAVLVFEDGTKPELTSGSLKSYLEMLNGNGVYAEGNQTTHHGIPYYKSVIDKFAATFAKTMNEINGVGVEDGRAMFVSASGGDITATNIRISDEWMADATMIAKIYDEDSGSYITNPTLQNTNIVKLLDGLSKTVTFGNHGDFEGSMHEYISFYSNRLSQQIDYVSSQQESAETTMLSLLESRDSISAVDMEEEGINMLNYQKWFNASARMMTTLDEALNTIINNMGLVGR